MKKLITAEISIILGYILAIHIFEILILPSLLAPTQILSGYSLAQRFFNIWTTNADTFHYMLAAKEGYPTANPAFFPLMPILLKVTFANSYTAKILSLVLAVIFILVFKKLIDLFKQSRNSQLILFSFLAFPASFLIVAPFSETLYLPLSALAIYFAEKNNFAKSAFFITLATATRLIGVALVLYLFLKILKKGSKELKKSFWTLLVAPLGIILFAAFLQLETGDFTGLYAGHKEWGRSISAANFLNLITTSKELVSHIFAPVKPPAINLIHFGSVFFFAVLAVVSFKKIKFPLWFYCVLAIIIPLISGTYVGIPRYILVTFPLFIPFAGFLENHKTLMYLYFFLALMLQAFLLLRFFNFEVAA